MVLDEIRPGDRYAVTREIARLLCERGGMPAGSDPEAAAVRWAEDYTRRCEEGVSSCPEIPGASAALEALAGRGIALFVNSATPEKPLQRVARLRSMSHHFRRILGGPASKLANLRRIGDEAGVAREGAALRGGWRGRPERRGELRLPLRRRGATGAAPLRARAGNRIDDLSGLPRVVAELEGETP